MSGGAALGTYHGGVVYALLRSNLLPKVITGSSVGSIIASLICTYTDEEFERVVKDPTLLNLTFYDKQKYNGGVGRSLFRLRFVYIHTFILYYYHYSSSFIIAYYY